MKKWLPLIIIVVIIIGIFRWGVGLNNTMVEKQETARTQWANVESAYQRRADLIPNLVNTVKGYADFEKESRTEGQPEFPGASESARRHREQDQC